MFVIWGALHGGALVIHRCWKKLGCNMPSPLAWLITFIFVNITWVFFRAHSLGDAKKILSGMIDFGSLNAMTMIQAPTTMIEWSGTLGDTLANYLPVPVVENFICLILISFAFIITSFKNAYELTIIKGSYVAKTIWMTVLFIIAMFATIQSTSTVFLYFNF